MPSINPQAVRGPVTAVPVVAGTGVRFVEDTQNNRVVAEVDETVLWEGSIPSTGGANLDTSITLSEAITNFERIRIYIASNMFSLCEISSAYPKAKHIQDEGPNSTAYIGYYIHCDDSTHLTYQCGFKTTFIGAYSGGYWNYGAPYKIVGINRVASA